MFLLLSDLLQALLVEVLPLLLVLVLSKLLLTHDTMQFLASQGFLVLFALFYMLMLFFLQVSYLFQLIFELGSQQFILSLAHEVVLQVVLRLLLGLIHLLVLTGDLKVDLGGVGHRRAQVGLRRGG